MSRAVTAEIDVHQGIAGRSAYQTWLALGNEGTEQDFLNTLVGAQGIQGERGLQGIQGEQGTPGLDGISALSTNTASNLTGLIKANGSVVQVAVPDVDYGSVNADVEPTIISSTNLYDFATASLTAGYINSSGTVSATSPNTYHPSPFIAWGSNSVISTGLNGAIPGTGSYSAMQYDANYNPISASWTGNSANIKTMNKYAGAVYFRISMRETSQNQINYGSSVLAYEAFYHYGLAEKLKNEFPMKFKPNPNDTDLAAKYLSKATEGLKAYEYSQQLWIEKAVLSVLKPNTTIDNISNFGNIVAAVNSITDASYYKPYEIQLYADIMVYDGSGFYDTPGMTGFKTLAYLRNYITLRGMGQQKQIHAELPNNTTLDPQYYITLHLDGGGSLENLKITGRNIRYPIHSDRALGSLYLNQNTVSIIRNCYVEHQGNYSGLAHPFTSTDAFGCGTSQGQIIIAVNSIFIGARHAFRVHTARPCVYPIRLSLINCTLYGTPNAINLDDNSSNASNELELINCNVNGWVVFTETSSTYINKTCIPFPKITGGGNNTLYFKNTITYSKGLRVTSSTTGVSSSATVKTDIDLFGKLFFRYGNNGVAAWVNGDECVTATDYLLADRLGDCSGTPKTLVLTIDGVDRNVVFNQNYTGVSNTTILASMNSQLTGYATVTLDHPVLSYFAELSNVLFLKKYDGATLIPKGTFVKFSDVNKIRALTTGETPDGYLLDDASTGEFVRVLNNAIVLNTGQFAPLFYSTNVFTEGNKFNIQDGKLIVDSNSTLKIIAISSSLIKVQL